MILFHIVWVRSSEIIRANAKTYGRRTAKENITKLVQLLRRDQSRVKDKQWKDKDIKMHIINKGKGFKFRREISC